MHFRQFEYIPLVLRIQFSLYQIPSSALASNFTRIGRVLQMFITTEHRRILGISTNDTEIAVSKLIEMFGWNSKFRADMCAKIAKKSLAFLDRHWLKNSPRAGGAGKQDNKWWRKSPHTSNVWIRYLGPPGNGVGKIVLLSTYYRGIRSTTATWSSSWAGKQFAEHRIANDTCRRDVIA